MGFFANLFKKKSDKKSDFSKDMKKIEKKTKKLDNSAANTKIKCAPKNRRPPCKNIVKNRISSISDVDVILEESFNDKVFCPVENGFPFEEKNENNLTDNKNLDEIETNIKTETNGKIEIDTEVKEATSPETNFNVLDSSTNIKEVSTDDINKSVENGKYDSNTEISNESDTKQNNIGEIDQANINNLEKQNDDSVTPCHNEIKNDTNSCCSEEIKTSIEKDCLSNNDIQNGENTSPFIDENHAITNVVSKLIKSSSINESYEITEEDDISERSQQNIIKEEDEDKDNITQEEPQQNIAEYEPQNIEISEKTKHIDASELTQNNGIVEKQIHYEINNDPQQVENYNKSQNIDNHYELKDINNNEKTQSNELSN